MRCHFATQLCPGCAMAIRPSNCDVVQSWMATLSCCSCTCRGTHISTAARSRQRGKGDTYLQYLVAVRTALLQKVVARLHEETAEAGAQLLGVARERHVGVPRLARLEDEAEGERRRQLR